MYSTSCCVIICFPLLTCNHTPSSHALCLIIDYYISYLNTLPLTEKQKRNFLNNLLFILVNNFPCFKVYQEIYKMLYRKLIWKNLIINSASPCEACRLKMCIKILCTCWYDLYVELPNLAQGSRLGDNISPGTPVGTHQLYVWANRSNFTSLYFWCIPVDRGNSVQRK